MQAPFREDSMSRHLIVDGYNLARSGTVLLPGDPAGPEGRGELCSLLSAYARKNGLRLTVVFDARGAEAPQRTRQPFKGGTAVFSSRSETADDVIRDLARNATTGTIVVTSDRGLRGTLPTRDVAILSCEEFADRLSACRQEEAEGTADGEERGGGRKGKKGEGHRKKKRDRERDRVLRNL
jgi:predicted RNA-binding protein with PIN domain